jgi:uncharacterized alkaline shock family protein YloU
MSETEGQRNASPLLSERGVTTISDTVVSSLAGMAAQEVDGVHMGGGASRAAGGVLGSITGSESRTSGITVEVGRTETAIDLKMGIEYNKNILQTVEEVRRRITDRIESMTGLRIKELNATITDITFPETEARRRLGPAKPPSESVESPEATTSTAPETRATPEEQLGEPAEREETTQAETTQVETTEAETTEAEATEAEVAEAETTITPAEDSSVPEEEATAPTEDSSVAEEATAEERSPEEGETTELRTEEELAEASEAVTEAESETAEESETPEEVQTPPEPETPEARMRRRAEERARRRRRRAQDS